MNGRRCFLMVIVCATLAHFDCSIWCTFLEPNNIAPHVRVLRNSETFIGCWLRIGTEYLQKVHCCHKPNIFGPNICSRLCEMNEYLQIKCIIAYYIMKNDACFHSRLSLFLSLSSHPTAFVSVLLFIGQ